MTTSEGNVEYIEDDLITDKVENDETKDKSLAECNEIKYNTED